MKPKKTPLPASVNPLPPRTSTTSSQLEISHFSDEVREFPSGRGKGNEGDLSAIDVEVTLLD